MITILTILTILTMIFNITYNSLLLVLISIITILKITFVFLAFNISGVESIIIYIILLYLLFFNKGFFSTVIQKILLVLSIITLLSMFLKIDSSISHLDFVYLLDLTPSILEYIRDSLFSVAESKPKINPNYVPSPKPEVVQMWKRGDYRLIVENMGESALMGASASGFIMTCKPLLATTKSGKILIGSIGVLPIINRFF
jgi:hypothetical protein